MQLLPNGDHHDGPTNRTTYHVPKTRLHKPTAEATLQRTRAHFLRPRNPSLPTDFPRVFQGLPPAFLAKTAKWALVSAIIIHNICQFVHLLHCELLSRLLKPGLQEIPERFHYTLDSRSGPGTTQISGLTLRCRRCPGFVRPMPRATRSPWPF